mmetsp:Transcript_11838/g.34932  ORF Transcript_11838/g.34932 Transcript_11838/m.34932 type:complete len:226 (+) Transcript_11838:221-898(+)
MPGGAPAGSDAAAAACAAAAPRRLGSNAATSLHRVRHRLCRQARQAPTRRVCGSQPEGGVCRPRPRPRRPAACAQTTHGARTARPPPPPPTPRRRCHRRASRTQQSPAMVRRRPCWWCRPLRQHARCRAPPQRLVHGRSSRPTAARPHQPQTRQHRCHYQDPWARTVAAAVAHGRRGTWQRAAHVQPPPARRLGRLRRQPPRCAAGVAPRAPGRCGGQAAAGPRA